MNDIHSDLESLESNSVYSDEGALNMEDPKVEDLIRCLCTINDELYNLQNRFTFIVGVASDKFIESRRSNSFVKMPVVQGYFQLSNPGIGRGVPIQQQQPERPGLGSRATTIEPKGPNFPPNVAQIKYNAIPTAKPVTENGYGAAPPLRRPLDEPPITGNGSSSVKPFAGDGSKPAPLRRPYIPPNEPRITAQRPPSSVKPVMENGLRATLFERPPNESQIPVDYRAMEDGSIPLTLRRPKCPPKGIVKPPSPKASPLPPSDGFLPPPIINNNNNNNVKASGDFKQSSSERSASPQLNQSRILPPPPKPKLPPPPPASKPSVENHSVPASPASSTSASARTFLRPPPPPYSKIKQLLESGQLSDSESLHSTPVLPKHEARPNESRVRESSQASQVTSTASTKPTDPSGSATNSHPLTVSNVGIGKRTQAEKNTSLGSNSLFQTFSLKDYFVDSNYPKGEKTIKTKLDFEVSNLDRPIGLTVLSDGNIVVAVSGRDEVHMYDVKGKLIKKLTSNRTFVRPTDMVNLQNGHFAIRDDGGVQIFKEDGTFSRAVGQGVFARCFGLATDGQGHLIAINCGSRVSKLTKPGQTDVLFINIETGQVVRRIELEPVITNKATSKCRFLSCDGKRLYVVDLGLDLIYAINMKTAEVRTFGGSGRQGGKFSDPAGMAIDKSGNLIIADAGNHRLQIFDKKRNYLGLVNTAKSLRRPSGIAFDSNSASLFVLNLRSSSLTKYTLIPN